MLLRAQHKIVSIVTPEEEEAFVLRICFSRRATPVPATEAAAAAMLHLLGHQRTLLTVMFNVAEHLSDARTMRLLRDRVLHNRHFHGHLALVDQVPVPQAMRAITTDFQPSLEHRTGGEAQAAPGDIPTTAATGDSREGATRHPFPRSLGSLPLAPG